MPLTIRGVEVENLIVKYEKTGEEFIVDLFNDKNGNVIFEKFSLKDLILNISLTSESYMSPTLQFEKSTDSVTTIDWGDGTSETTSTAGANAINHTYSSLGDYDITISDNGGYIKPMAGVLGNTVNNIDGVGYPASLVGVTLGTIVKEIGEDAFLNSKVKPEDVICHNGIVSIEVNAFTTPTNMTDRTMSYMTSKDGTTKYLIQVNAGVYNLENIFEEETILLADSCFAPRTTSGNVLTIPNHIKYIGKVAFGGVSWESLTFEHSNTDDIVLPEAGDGSGMLYGKNARTTTIYTDNETIKNYDYAADNITATILHLDGSAWE